MKYRSLSPMRYRVAQAACRVVSGLLFRPKVLRNELKGKKGPCVIIGNHECFLDFVDLLPQIDRPMAMVISRSFFETMPIVGKVLGEGTILPKLQFQTTTGDMRWMRSAVEHGDPLLIYPAGLMCEDGLPTPTPTATYKFLKWLGADVYVARITGSYFVAPKWSPTMHPGRTYMDIYRLIDGETLKKTDLPELKSMVDDALHFDAYAEQEKLRERYHGADDLRGLENVLYRCPHCGAEFTMQVKNRHTLHCTACGFAETGDKYGFFHRESTFGEEIPTVAAWSTWIQSELREAVTSGALTELETPMEIRMVDPDRHRFVTVGSGSVRIRPGDIALTGTVNGEEREVHVPSHMIPTLPFKPGGHFEIQHGDENYRCIPRDKRQVMKFIHYIKVLYMLQGTAKKE